MTSTISDRIVQALEKVLSGKTVLHEPVFSGNEWSYVKECLDTSFVSSVGKFVDRLELMLAEYTGAAKAIAVVNGTAALHMCLLLAGARRNDEILIPTLSFVATANAVAYIGAIPHFTEHSRTTLGMCPEALGEYLASIAEIKADGYAWNRKTGRRISACVPMHTFGHPVDLDALVEVCDRFNIALVEDAAESLGSYYKGKHTGNAGLVSALSFNGNKIVTTGGGGAILTNDLELAALAKHLTTTAKVPHPWNYIHDHVGYNYRMPNINAALGCAQIEQLPGFVERKRDLAQRYAEAFQGISGVRFFQEPKDAKSNYWLNAILIDPNSNGEVTQVLESTNGRGFMTRPVWAPLHTLAMYANCPRMEIPVAQELANSIVNIPSGAKL
jgi:perosamine synthetase